MKPGQGFAVKIRAECLYVIVRGRAELPSLASFDGVAHVPAFQRLCDALRFLARVSPADASISVCEDIASLQGTAKSIPGVRGIALDPELDEASGEWRFAFVEDVTGGTDES